MNGYYSYGSPYYAVGGPYAYAVGGPYAYGPYVGQVLPQFPQQSTSAVHKKLTEAFKLHFKGREPAWTELVDFLLAITIEMAQQSGMDPEFIKQRIEYAFLYPYR